MHRQRGLCSQPRPSPWQPLELRAAGAGGSRVAGATVAMTTLALSGPRGRGARTPLARPAPPFTAAVTPPAAAGGPPAAAVSRPVATRPPAAARASTACLRSSAVLASQRAPCTREEAARGLTLPRLLRPQDGQCPPPGAAQPSPADSCSSACRRPGSDRERRLDPRSRDSPAPRRRRRRPRPHPGGLAAPRLLPSPPAVAPSLLRREPLAAAPGRRPPPETQDGRGRVTG